MKSKDDGRVYMKTYSENLPYSRNMESHVKTVSVEGVPMNLRFRNKG